MRSPRLWLSAAFAALAACPAWASDTITAGGVGSFGGDAAVTQNLKGSTDDPADTVEVFCGRFRPYWRGYYHAQNGYGPRPNLYGGPILASRFYGYRPGIGGYAFAAQQPVAFAAAPIVSAGPSIAYSMNVAPAPVAETAAPPLAPAPQNEFVPAFNRVNGTAKKPAYAAYGEETTPRPATMLAKKPK